MEDKNISSQTETAENEVNSAPVSDSSEENTADDSVKKDRKFVGKDLFDVLESTIVTVFVIVMIFTYVLHPVNVVGRSMMPTLEDSNRLFMTTVTSFVSNGDVVIINNDAAYLIDGDNKVYKDTSDMFNECIIKRVIAVGGQEIDIDFNTHEVKVDGEILDEPYIREATSLNSGAFSYPFTVPEGYYFVMGDNRNESADSRNRYVGLISKDQIYGQALMRYYPGFKLLV